MIKIHMELNCVSKFSWWGYHLQIDKSRQALEILKFEWEYITHIYGIKKFHGRLNVIQYFKEAIFYHSKISTISISNGTYKEEFAYYTLCTSAPCSALRKVFKLPNFKFSVIFTKIK